jgi:hypothetical protein
MKKEILSTKKKWVNWRSDTWKKKNGELTKTLHPLINDKTKNSMAKNTREMTRKKRLETERPKTKGIGWNWQGKTKKWD